MRDLEQVPLNDPIFRDVSFDEEVFEASETRREAFANIAPVDEVEAMRRRWAQRLDEAIKSEKEAQQ